MPATIIVTRPAVGATQRADLEKLFASPSYLLLREIVASRCIAHQAEAMNAALYPDNEDAKVRFEVERQKASDCNKVLDMLDDLQEKAEEWTVVKLEHAAH